MEAFQSFSQLLNRKLDVDDKGVPEPEPDPEPETPGAVALTR